MKEICKLKDFLNINVYYPNPYISGDRCWVDLKDKIAKYFCVYHHHITIKQVAEYLISHPEYKSKITDRIYEIYSDFKIDKILKIKREMCPSIGDRPEQKFFLRGGNKSSIAYAMKILKKEEKFRPLPVSWYPNFTRYDDDDLKKNKKGSILDEG